MQLNGVEFTIYKNALKLNKIIDTGLHWSIMQRNLVLQNLAKIQPLYGLSSYSDSRANALRVSLRMGKTYRLPHPDTVKTRQFFCHFLTFASKNKCIFIKKIAETCQLHADSNGNMTIQDIMQNGGNCHQITLLINCNNTFVLK